MAEKERIGRAIFLEQLVHMSQNKLELETEWLSDKYKNTCSKFAAMLAVPDNLRDAFNAYYLDYVSEGNGATHLDGIFFNDEDVKSGIYQKMYYFYRPIFDCVESATGVRIDTYIEPNYNGRSYIVAIATQYKGTYLMVPFVVFGDSIKVWCSFFDQENLPDGLYADLEAIYDSVRKAVVKGLRANDITLPGEESVDTFVIALVESGLLASTWVVEGTEDSAIETAEALAKELQLNIEKHDLAVEKPLVIRQGKELFRNSERVWTWIPDEEELGKCQV